MSGLGITTRADIEGQIDAWVDVNRMLDKESGPVIEAWRELDIDRVHVAGCGSVNFLSQTMAPLLQRSTGLPCTSSPGAALLSTGSFQPIVKPSRTLLLAGSRSGETSEILAAVDAFRAAGTGPVWCITTRSESSLAERSDLVISEDSGFEPSVVQTRSFSSLLAMMQGMSALVSGDLRPTSDEVEKSGRRCLELSAQLVERLDPISRFRRVIFVASRALYGIAQEGQLLMNEMALTDAVAHYLLDFRHGPISMVDSETLVVALLDAEASEHEVAVLSEAASFGGTVVTLSSGRRGPAGQPTVMIDPDEIGCLALYMPPLQLMALSRAVAMGVDPDHPRNLSAVVHLDEVS